MLGPNKGLKDYLQQRNAINVLLALHHVPNPQWGKVKKYVLENLRVTSLSDYSYRRLCKELVKIRLARAVASGSLKNDYHLTERGHETAAIIEQALQRVERWRARAFRNKKTLGVDYRDRSI
jgi:hypothetical protein